MCCNMLSAYQYSSWCSSGDLKGHSALLWHCCLKNKRKAMFLGGKMCHKEAGNIYLWICTVFLDLDMVCSRKAWLIYLSLHWLSTDIVFFFFWQKLIAIKLHKMCISPKWTHLLSAAGKHQAVAKELRKREAFSLHLFNLFHLTTRKPGTQFPTSMSH